MGVGQPVEIESGVVTGQFPRRGLHAVLEWYEIHKADLAEDWDRARQKLPLKPIEPLEEAYVNPRCRSKVHPGLHDVGTL